MQLCSSYLPTAAVEVLKPVLGVALWAPGCTVPVYIHIWQSLVPSGDRSDSGEVRAMTSHRSCETLLAVILVYSDPNTQTDDKSIVP
jgi:hypothetical protein